MPVQLLALEGRNRVLMPTNLYLSVLFRSSRHFFSLRVPRAVSNTSLMGRAPGVSQSRPLGTGKRPKTHRSKTQA
jgi:hypothetical protein